MKLGMHVKNMKVQDLIRDLRQGDLMDKGRYGMVMMIWRIPLVMMGGGRRELRIRLEVGRDGLRMRRGKVRVVHREVEEVCLMKIFNCWEAQLKEDSELKGLRVDFRWDKNYCY